LRLRGRALTSLARLGRGKRATTPQAFLLASASRRGEALNRGLLLVGLLLAFGVSLGVFTATYNQQSRVDAELTLGADAVVTAPAGAIQQKKLTAAVSRVAGVSRVSPMDHSYAYVGPDLQDIFGVDPATVANATTLRDSYFIGGNAKQILDRLRSTPDGVLVSKETITDYSVGVGDLLKLRVLDRSTGKFHVAPFHVVGIVTEFPSAPHDSFMVTNLAYLTARTHDGGPNLLLVRTKGDPSSVAQRIAAATKSAGTSVGDIHQTTAKIVSSITAVDLSGISRIEEAFALVLAAAAMGLFVAVAVGERRQELATMGALGASLKEISAFLWTEAGLVLAGSLAFAAVLGLLIAKMLVAMLQHVFDPPPDHLAIPWAFAGGLTAAAVAGTLLAAALAIRTIRRLPLGAILREE
ncbi:MAG: putative transport system permease protein, partial [Gaiellaceae bacterium]|nr:putative transport system permease protein [Gaiellaceae bacterium]